VEISIRKGNMPMEEKRWYEKTLEDRLEELERCNQCKFCTTVCPLWDGWFVHASSGKMRSIRSVVKGTAKPDEKLVDVMYYCTVCGRCEQMCKSHSGGLITTEIIEEMRHQMVYKYGLYLPRHKEICSDVLRDYNPYHGKHEDRFSWLTRTPPNKGEYVYFVGCTDAYRMKDVAVATTELLLDSGVNLTMFWKELCCSSVLLRTGFVEDAIPIMEKNRKNLMETGAKVAVTSCAGCYRTLKKDYERIGGAGIEIQHSSELLRDLINNGKIKCKRGMNGVRATYHDPCHLGRHCDFYDAPREVIDRIPGLEFVEMSNNRENSVCCGAGGGFRSGFTDKSVEMAYKRLLEAKDIGAKLLITCCPFCELNLKQASEVKKSRVKVMDLTELVTSLL